MRRKNSALIGLLNLNGSLYQGVQFHEPYQFSHLLGKSHPSSNSSQNLSQNEDVMGLGEFVVEKLRRIKSLSTSIRGGVWRNFGMSPYLEKFMRKSSGKIV